MTTLPTCADCGSAPATRGRFCEPCIERTAAEECVRAGMPPEGRDPAEVRRELRIRRAAAELLLGRLTGDDEMQAEAMRVVLIEAPGAHPAAALVPPLLVLVELLAGCPRGLLDDDPADTLLEAGFRAMETAQEAGHPHELTAALATAATASLLVCCLDREPAGEPRGRLAELAAGTDTTPERLMHGPLLGLLNDHLRGPARAHLVAALRRDLLLHSPPAPDDPSTLLPPGEPAS